MRGSMSRPERCECGTSCTVGWRPTRALVAQRGHHSGAGLIDSMALEASGERR